MNSGIAPFMLIAATVGLMLGLVTWRLALAGAAAFACAALLAFALPMALPLTIVFLGLFLSLIAIGIMIYLPVPKWRLAVVPMSTIAGLWLGACAALTSTLGGLAVGSLAVVLAIPAHWITQRQFPVLIKVVASWMIAIASLSLFVSLTPTPGYEPDHME